MTKKGFTLLEVIIAIGITAIIAGAIYSILDGCLDAYNSGIEEAEYLTNVMIASNFIARDIREAKEITEVGNDYIKLLREDGTSCSYRVKNKDVYKTSPEGSFLIIENVDFNLSSDADRRFVSIIMKQETETYRAGAAVRNLTKP